MHTISTRMLIEAGLEIAAEIAAETVGIAAETVEVAAEIAEIAVDVEATFKQPGLINFKTRTRLENVSGRFFMR